MPRPPSYNADAQDAPYESQATRAALAHYGIGVTRAEVLQAGCGGREGPVAKRLRTILSRPEGLGKADPAALWTAVRAVAYSRGALEYRRLLSDRDGERGLASARAVVLGRLDDAIEKALAELRNASELASLIRAADAQLIASLAAIQASVRVSARLRLQEYPLGRSRKGGRRQVHHRAQMVADFRRLGATAREAEYLVTNISPRPPQEVSGTLGVLSGLL